MCVRITLSDHPLMLYVFTENDAVKQRCTSPPHVCFI